MWNARDPNLPPDAVWADRSSNWGNPFRITKSRNRERAVREHKMWLDGDPGLRVLKGPPPSRQEIREALRGKNLVCWCAPLACHADVLLEIANAE